ncbi:DinB family protein [Maribacter sp.]|nr:DinB family protein [Maribacter sp.]
MPDQLQPIIENLVDCFDGKPWYGVSVMEKLEMISWKRVNDKKYGNKSIAVLVQHIINWRIFVLKKLEGDAAYTIEMDSDTDWTPIQIENQQQWEGLKQQLVNTQTKILSLLHATDDAILSKQVPGKNYTFSPILTSIAQHDIYHLGQIAMLNYEQSS